MGGLVDQVGSKEGSKEEETKAAGEGEGVDEDEGGDAHQVEDLRPEAGFEFWNVPLRYPR